MSRRIAIAIVTSLAGAALLVWQVRSVGLDQIRLGLQQVGWGFLVVLVLSFLRFSLRSLAWTTLITERVPLSRAIGASITGDFIGNVTPLSLLVSEPAKAVYLRTGATTTSHALAALAAETFFYSTTIAAFIIAGCVAMLVAFDVPDSVRVAGLVALAAMVATLAGALWIVWREPAVASATLSRVPLLKLDAIVARVRDFESKTYGFVRQSRGRLSVVFACETSFQLLSIAESYAMLYLVTGRSLPLEAFVLDTVNRIVNIVFRVVPFKIGVDEMSAGFVAQAIGLGPAVGVTLGLVRKGRSIVWAAVGLGLLGRRAAGGK